MQKTSWKNYFIFTKRDRNAAFIFLSLIALLIALPYLVPAKKLEIHVDPILQRELDSLKENTQQTNYNLPVDTIIHDTTTATLFFFDPNTLSEEGFTKLGLSQKIIHTIINYRNKGGRFKTPEDIRKIYGLSKTDADRLIPYVRIASTTTIAKNEIKNDNPVTNNQTHQYKIININIATAEDWKAFPGIGDAIANRIIKFRTSVGGFKSVEQVAKTYGLSDSIFQQIKPYLYLKDSTNN
jgi:competence protein ComEA